MTRTLSHQERRLTVDTDPTQPNCEWFCKKPARLRLAARWAAARTAATLQNFYGNRYDDGFGILMYHRVAERVPGVEAPTSNVTPERLRQQLIGLLARGFECWPLSRLVAAHRESTAVPKNVFAVTFDDGYENNFLNAWPILREWNVPATIFVATKYLDTDRPFPFDDWSATGTSRVPASAWRPLGSSECEEMLASGLIELGAHTHSHERFLGRRDDFRRDMQICLDTLSERFGIEQPTFAFPFGDLDQELVGAAKELGVACCLTTQHRRVLPSDDVYQWGRLAAEGGDTPAVLAAKLSGWYATVTTSGKELAHPLSAISRAASRLSGRLRSPGLYREPSQTGEARPQR
jgi:peptidoglycan/xylan/chitin deacetylase (PgdA/CDA1 family)